MNAISLNYLWQLIKTLDKSDQDWLADKLIEARKESAEISSEIRDRKFLEQLWALPLDDSKTADQKIKEVEDNRKKGIIRDLSYVKQHLLTGYQRALENAGEPIGDADVMIAATAYVNNMTLVTNNIKHFSRIGNIQVVSW